MDCQRTLELLSPLVDGELPLDLSRPVLTHLAACAACRARADALRSMGVVVRDMAANAPPGLSAAILREARVHREDRRAPLTGILAMWPRAAAMAVGAAAVMLCLSLVSSGSLPTAPVSPRATFGRLVSESEAGLELAGSFRGDSRALASSPVGRLIADLTGGR
jgi:anti-sigma factor RsiW